MTVLDEIAPSRLHETPQPTARSSVMSAITSSSKRSPAAAWGSSTRPGSASANRLVALKMILSGQMASADERERFLREAELAANLDHQHIVPIYEVAEFQGCPFFSMKLIEGESLSQQIKARKRSGTCTTRRRPRG